MEPPVGHSSQSSRTVKWYPARGGRSMSDSNRLLDRWRPKRFRDIVGQADVVRPLLEYVGNPDTLPGALLFTGPPGTGKTTAARVLAAALGCIDRGADGEPCGECRMCLD